MNGFKEVSCGAVSPKGSALTLSSFFFGRKLEPLNNLV
jgi:hypothetical protein